MADTTMAGEHTAHELGVGLRTLAKRLGAMAMPNCAAICDEAAELLDPGSDGIPYEAIVGYLNELTGHAYEWQGPRGECNRRMIRQLWRKGFRGPDFRLVFEDRTAAWGHAPARGEKDMRYCLRPSTLLRERNFVNYLGQARG